MKERRWQRDDCSNYRALFLDPDRLAYPLAPKGTCKASKDGKKAARERLAMNKGAHSRHPSKYKSKEESYAKPS
jgi:hypothetical protein